MSTPSPTAGDDPPICGAQNAGMTCDLPAGHAEAHSAPTQSYASPDGITLQEGLELGLLRNVYASDGTVGIASAHHVCPVELLPGVLCSRWRNHEGLHWT